MKMNNGRLEAEKADFELMRQVQFDRVCSALDSLEGAPEEQKEMAARWLKSQILHLKNTEDEMVRRGYITEEQKSDCTVQGLRRETRGVLGHLRKV